MRVSTEVYSDLAYVYDGSLEGLLSAVFAAYERHENPNDVEPESRLQPRLGQYVYEVPTNLEHATRVRNGLRRSCGNAVFEAVLYASLSDDPHAGTAAYRFVRYAMDVHRKQFGRRYSAFSNAAHPDVAPICHLKRHVGCEKEHMLQFIRFEELEGGLWFARCNPNASVVPLVMDHFAARFNTQPFIIFDEVHELAGVYTGADWRLVKPEGPELQLPDKAAGEAAMQRAWRRFYQAVSVESRYNPELRRQFMPKRLWKNLTEMQTDPSALVDSLPAPALHAAAALQ